MRSIAGQVHVALLAAAVILLAWPDWRLPYRFLTGFKITDTLERSGNYNPVEPVEPLSRDELFRLGADNLRELQTW